MKNNSDTSTSKGSEKSSKSPSKSLRQLMKEGRDKAVSLYSRNSFEPEIMDHYEAVNNYKVFEEKKTAYIEQESTGHYCIWDHKYPENPERVAFARRRLQSLDLLRRCIRITPETFPDEIFLRTHSKDLLELLKSCSNMSIQKLRGESSKWDAVFLTRETYEDAILCAEAALSLTLKVANNEFKNGFALIRPPGHHAMANAFCGYCLINNVAICAETAIANGLAKKVLIVDYDVHHGQGVQQLFYDRDDILYFSIHRYENGMFWPYLRESDSDFIGSGRGKGYNVNVPLNKTGLGDSDYLAIVLNLLLPLAYEYNPDLILISAGYDAAIGCPEGEMLVTPHFYGHLVTLLSGLANGKLVVLLEGGYFKDSLAEGVACTLKALLGDICYPISIENNPTVEPALQDVINNVKYFLKDYWKCFQTDQLFDYPRLTNLTFDDLDEHVTILEYTKGVEDADTYATSDCYPVHSDEAVQKFVEMIDEVKEVYSKSRVCYDIVGLAYDEVLLKHKPTVESGKCPPERPERLTAILKHLDEFGLRQRCKHIELMKFDETYWLKQVHSKDYVHNILNRERITEKPDWYFNEYTSTAVLKCVSCVLSLAQSISDGDIRAGVAIIRPPGHHAMGNNGCGFCFVNNVVVAAQYLTEKRHFKRVLIVDFDIHHGNGTQELTYERSDILYISIHRFDNVKFFPGRDEADHIYTGSNNGKGYNVNIPFNKDKKKNVDYWSVWCKLVLPIAYSYNPDFVIVSAGFDAGIYDPLGGGYQLTPEMYAHFIQTLKPLASGRILLALEGGYHLETTALSMVACVKALLGDSLPVPNLSESTGEDTSETIKNVVLQHRSKWPLLQVNKKIANFWCVKEQLTELKNLAQLDPADDIVQQFENLVVKCKNNPIGSYNA